MTAPTPSLPCFVTPGPLQIWVDTGAAHAPEFLGYTRGGATIQEQAFFDELKSDASGGERGPAADFQYLGEQHMVDLDLAQYNEAILAKLAVRVNVAATRTKGMLIGCAVGYFRLVLWASNFQRNYTRAFIIDPITRAPIGTGTTYPRIGFTCLEDPANVKGTLGAPSDNAPWNTNITVAGGAIT